MNHRVLLFLTSAPTCPIFKRLQMGTHWALDISHVRQRHIWPATQAIHLGRIHQFFTKPATETTMGLSEKCDGKPLKIPWFIASLLSIQQLPKDCQSTGWSCLKWPYISYILQLPAYSKIKELRVALPHRYPYYIHGFFPTSHGSGVALPCAHLTNAKFASNDYVMLQQEVVGGVESSSFDKSGGKPPIH